LIAPPGDLSAINSSAPPARGAAPTEVSYRLHHRVPPGPKAATWPVFLRHQASFWPPNLQPPQKPRWKFGPQPPNASAGVAVDVRAVERIATPNSAAASIFIRNICSLLLWSGCELRVHLQRPPAARLSDQQLLPFCGRREPDGSRTNDAISYSVIVITRRSKCFAFYSGRDFVEVGELMSYGPAAMLAVPVARSAALPTERMRAGTSGSQV
jgi:hypothetical protein